jgi:DUF1680 family protein
MKKIILIFIIYFMNCSPESDLVLKTRFPKNIKIGGQLAKRVTLTTKRLQSHPYGLEFVVQDVARIEGKQRRFEEYEGDISGRILGAWSYMSRLLGERPEKLAKIVQEVLKHQNGTGYFGKNQMEEGFDYWGRQNFGHGRLLVGLLEYYKLTGEEKILNAAEKLGDYFAETIPQWTTKYEENPWKKSGKVDWKDNTSNRLHFIKTHQTSIMEGLVSLYEISQKPKYLVAAESIVPLFPEFGQFHSHSYLNSLVGIALLYEKTGKPAYRKLLEKIYWQDVMRKGFRPDGSVCEWYPSDFRTEGCSLTDLLRLHLHMWRITKDAVYLDEAERVWLNGLNFHQTSNGAFGHAILNSTGYEAGYSEAWWCCLMHGLFAYADIVNYTAAASQNDLWINLFTPFEGELELHTGKTTITIKTDYPSVGHVEVEMSPEKTFAFTTNLRIPSWADQLEVLVNGQPAEGILNNGFFSIARKWQSGDKIKLNFPINLRLEDEYGNAMLDKRRQNKDPQMAYFFYGPLILSVDKKFNQVFPDHLIFNPKESYKKNMGQEKKQYDIAAAHFNLPGMVVKQKRNFYLNPISEQTGYNIWTNELANFKRNGEEPIQRVAMQIQQKVIISSE